MARKSNRGTSYTLERRAHPDARLAALGVEQTILVPDLKPGEAPISSCWDKYMTPEGIVVLEDVIEANEVIDEEDFSDLDIVEEKNGEIDETLLSMLRSGTYKTVDANGDILEIENFDEIEAAFDIDEDEEYFEDGEDFIYDPEERDDGIIYDGGEMDADALAESIFGETEAADGEFEIEHLVDDLTNILNEMGGIDNLDLDTESTYYSKRGFLIHRFNHQKALEAVGRDNVAAAAQMLADVNPNFVQLKYLLEKEKEKTTFLDKTADTESNRPTRVSVPQRIKVARNGVPVEAFEQPESESDDEDEEMYETEIDLTRRPDETKEEKKARKKAAKELQSARRKQKKAFKEAFAKEERKLAKSRSNNSTNILGKTI